MKKTLFLFVVLCAFDVHARQNEVDIPNVEKGMRVMHLEKDSFYNFHFVHDVDVKSEFSSKHQLWKVRLEEVMDHKSLPEPHVEILWLKLDENCKPKPWDLQNFKINGHNFIIYLLKKKATK